jgi:hypothetical protein
MKITKIFTKKLNLSLRPKTYNLIEKLAVEDGRKPGSLARRILDEWAKEKESSMKMH